MQAPVPHSDTLWAQFAALTTLPTLGCVYGVLATTRLGQPTPSLTPLHTFNRIMHTHRLKCSQKGMHRHTGHCMQPVSAPIRLPLRIIQLFNANGTTMVLLLRYAGLDVVCSRPTWNWHNWLSNFDVVFDPVPPALGGPWPQAAIHQGFLHEVLDDAGELVEITGPAKTHRPLAAAHAERKRPVSSSRSRQSLLDVLVQYLLVDGHLPGPDTGNHPDQGTVSVSAEGSQAKQVGDATVSSGAAKNHAVQFVGMSAGGALSCLWSVAFLHQLRRLGDKAKRCKVEVVTFGAPRIGNVAFARGLVPSLFRPLQVPWRRWVHAIDPAASCPPRWLGFRHGGLELVVQDPVACFPQDAQTSQQTAKLARQAAKDGYTGWWDAFIHHARYVGVVFQFGDCAYPIPRTAYNCH